MQLFCAQPARRTPSFASLEGVSRSIAWVAAWVAACVGGRLTAGNESPCPGRAWTDSAERELTDRIAACRFPRP